MNSDFIRAQLSTKTIVLLYILDEAFYYHIYTHLLFIYFIFPVCNEQPLALTLKAHTEKKSPQGLPFNSQISQILQRNL